MNPDLFCDFVPPWTAAGDAVKFALCLQLFCECVGSTPTNDNTEDLSQYDPCCLTGHKTKSLSIIEEYQDELLMCIMTPDTKKEINVIFRHRWNVPKALDAVDGKHMAIRCPRGCGSHSFNNKAETLLYC